DETGSAWARERQAALHCPANHAAWAEQQRQRRGLAMRTDKLAFAYQAALHLAAILIWTQR
ncbi:hypothetical protein ACGFOW_16010, partial [Streptomyces rubiginosohelvolus]